MFAIVGVGALCVWVLRKKMPVSPRWLESKGRFAEAERILTDIETETAQGGELPPVVQSIRVKVQTTTLMALFRPPLLHRTLLAVLVQFVINVVIYGFIVWVPTFLMKQGHGMASSLGYTSLMALGGPAGALLGVFVADKVGRKNGLIVLGLLASIVGWCYSQSTTVEMATLLGFLLFTMTYLMVALGIATYIPELFSTENRMRANGIAGCSGRLAGIIAPQVVVVMYASGGIKDGLYVIIGALLVMVAALALLGLETNQRSLEDIASQTDRPLPSRATSHYCSDRCT